MKKLLISFVMAAFAGIAANADTTASCPVSGSGDGATLTADFSYNAEKNKVTVTFYNDSDKSATATATVSNGATKVKVSAMVYPNYTASKTVDWPGSSQPTNIDINSAKCD